MTKKRTPHSSKRATKKSNERKELMTIASPVALRPAAMLRMRKAFEHQDYKIVKRCIGIRLGEGVQVLLNDYAKRVGIARNKIIVAAIVAACSGQTVLNFDESKED